MKEHRGINIEAPASGRRASQSYLLTSLRQAAVATVSSTSNRLMCWWVDSRWLNQTVTKKIVTFVSLIFRNLLPSYVTLLKVCVQPFILPLIYYDTDKTHNSVTSVKLTNYYNNSVSTSSTLYVEVNVKFHLVYFRWVITWDDDVRRALNFAKRTRATRNSSPVTGLEEKHFQHKINK